MAIIIDAATEDAVSSAQTSLDAQVVAAGTFGKGAAVVIEVSQDSLGYVPLHVFDRPGAKLLQLKSGTSWRARLINAVAGVTEVSVSALS